MAKDGDGRLRQPRGAGSAGGDEPPADTSPIDGLAARQTEEFAAPSDGAKAGDAAGAAAQPRPYTMLEILGRGGMGEVRKAFDARLGRYVALKILRNTSAEHALRLMSEARAQARVEHANVCKVYDVGELDGQPFIALQYVDGSTLAAAAPSMAREQLIKLMKEVAEALHAAHRQGLVHRDVKPSNILVEKRDNGDYIPYVADFGIARHVEGPSVTATGGPVGTPLYMAPEQARGESQSIDRRTDVYGLGATLYELLARQPPFAGATAVEVMARVVNDEPRPLRAIDPGIPADLECIVLKAIEKRPADRYDSARAFAEDLQRYLDGDAILARRGGLVHQLVRRARKHRALVAVASAAALLAAIAGGVAIQARRTAATRVELARSFGQEVERIDAIARYAALLPLHDTEQEMAAIRDRMGRIRAQMQSYGAVSAGPGHHALGRGYLALGRYEDALRELDQAWASGERSSEVAYALGVAHGRRYQQGIAAMSRSKDPVLDDLRRAELSRRDREPALRYLKSIGGQRDVVGWATSEAGEGEYAEALIALYEGRYADALAKADAATARVRWLHEAQSLKGDVHLIAGKELAWKGDFDGARRELGLAGVAYRAAIEVAHSSTAAWLGDCQQRVTQLRLDLERDVPLEKQAEEATATCSAAHTTRSDDPTPLATEAEAWQVLSYYLGDHGQDVTHAEDEAIRLADAALRLDPGHMGALLILGRVYLWRARRQSHEQQGDANASLKRAIEMGQRALAVDPRQYDALILLSQSYWTQGEQQIGADLDPRASLAEVDRFGDRALAISPSGLFAWNILGNADLLRGNWETEHGLDPTVAYHKALQTFDKVIAINPKVDYGFGNACSAHTFYSRYQERRGIDPTHTVEQALAACKKAIAIKADYAGPYGLMAEARLSLAAWQLDEGTSPLSTIADALADVRKALAVDPKDFGNARDTAGQLELIAARWQLGHDADPTARFAAAADDFERALDWNGLAEVHRWRAEWLLERRRSASDELRQGLALSARVLAKSPTLAGAISTQGALELLSARAASGQVRTDAARRAVQRLARALELDANLERAARPLLAEAQRLSAP